MKTILIIEDNVPMQKLLQDKLASAERRVLTAQDGPGGMSLIRSEKPDCILLDIMLPGGMNGFDVLGQIKHDTALKDIPVLMLTNLDTEEKTSRAIGAADYIVKDQATLDDIEKKVAAVLG